MKTGTRRLFIGFAAMVFISIIFVWITPCVQAREINDLGKIVGVADAPIPIAIPALQAAPGSSPMRKGLIRDVIYEDLIMSGYFKPAASQNLIEQQNRMDLRKGGVRSGKVDFGEWGRLGAQFLVRGDYKIGADSALEAEILLYDAQGHLIFGRRFAGTTQAQYTLLAHRISDEIILRVKGIPGIASTKILFVSDRTGQSEIWMMDANGENEQQLTFHRALALTPTWGANQTEFYFTSYRKRNPDLYGQIIRTGKSWPISRFGGLNTSPDWNDESQKLLLTLGKDGNSEIYTMDRSGKNLKRITRNKYIDSAPSWSPDGKTIYFTSDRNGSPQIFRMSAEGANAKRLTWQGRYNDGAQVSPDGKRIAFSGRTNSIFHIFVMSSNGKDWVQLTKGSSNNQDPTWAPDGHHLAFVSDRTGRKQVYIIDAETGTNLRQLTSEGKNRMPAWSGFFN